MIITAIDAAVVVADIKNLSLSYSLSSMLIKIWYRQQQQRKLCCCLSLLTSSSPLFIVVPFLVDCHLPPLYRRSKTKFSSQTNERTEGLTCIEEGRCTELGRPFFYSLIKESVGT